MEDQFRSVFRCVCLDKAFQQHKRLRFQRLLFCALTHDPCPFGLFLRVRPRSRDADKEGDKQAWRVCHVLLQLGSPIALVQEPDGYALMVPSDSIISGSLPEDPESAAALELCDLDQPMGFFCDFPPLMLRNQMVPGPWRLWRLRQVLSQLKALLP